MTAPVIDGHAHICGTGQGGTGCSISPGLLSSLAFRYLRWTLGMSPFAEPRDLDDRVRARLFADLDGAPSVDFVVLYGHDRVYGPDGKARDDLTQLHTPNDYVLRLSGEHPKILPGVSIHPDRPDALEEMERCAAAGAVLVKWLPNSQGIDPRAARHRRFYEALRRLGLPLVSHTGGEHTVEIRWPQFTDPACLEPALDAGVTVILAHSGTKSGILDPDFLGTFATLARRYPNCWGDTAAFGTPGRMRHIPRLLADAEILARTVHGSDYPIPVSAWWGLGRIPVREIRRIGSIRSPIERDVAIKRAAGMPEAHFRSLAGLLPRLASRRPPRP